MGLLDKVKSAAQSAVGQAEDLIKKQKAAAEERAAAQKKAAAEEGYLKKLQPCGSQAKGSMFPPTEEREFCDCGLDDNEDFVVYYRKYTGMMGSTMQKVASFHKSDFAAFYVDKTTQREALYSFDTSYYFTVQLQSGETFTLYHSLSTSKERTASNLRKDSAKWLEMMRIIGYFGPIMQGDTTKNYINSFITEMGGNPVFTQDGTFDEGMYKIDLSGMSKAWVDIINQAPA